MCCSVASKAFPLNFFQEQEQCDDYFGHMLVYIVLETTECTGIIPDSHSSFELPILSTSTMHV